MEKISAWVTGMNPQGEPLEGAASYNPVDYKTTLDELLDLIRYMPATTDERDAAGDAPFTVGLNNRILAVSRHSMAAVGKPYVMCSEYRAWPCTLDEVEDAFRMAILGAVVSV